MKQINYEVMRSRDTLMCVALAYRKGRMPLSKSVISQYGEVALTCHDGEEEVLGSPQRPCPVDVLERLRQHHEGLLLVEFAQPGELPEHPDGGPVKEQLIKAAFPKIG